MFITPNMGLTAWDQGDDSFDHVQLANNMSAIDNHRHIPGEGRRIPTNGIEDGAITGPKLAPNAITADKIPDASITQQKLAKPSVDTPELFDYAVTNAKIANGSIGKSKVDSSISFIGDVRMWYRAVSSVSPPIGWEICDGRPWSSVANAMGPNGDPLATGNMPDLRGRYPIGAATSGTGTGATVPPDIGAVVGANTINFSHTHTVNDHVHTFITDVQGTHAHTFGGGNVIHTRQNAFARDIQVVDYATRNNPVPFARSNTLESIYVTEVGRGPSADLYVPMDTNGAHAHGGVTATAGPIGTASALSVTDTRPNSVGLLFIMRVI